MLASGAGHGTHGCVTRAVFHTRVAAAAIFVDGDSTSQAQLDDLGIWRQLIGGLGIGDHISTVVYDDGEQTRGCPFRPDPPHRPTDRRPPGR